MTQQARGVSAVLGVFVLLLFMTRVLEDLDNMVQQKASVWTAAQFFLLNLPPDIPRLLPFAFLIGSVFTAHHLVRRGEVTGMLSGGMSPRRIFAGVIYLAVLSSILVTLAWDVLAVPSERAKNALWSEIKQQQTTTGSSGVFHLLSDGRIVHAATFDPVDRVVTGLTLLEFDPVNPVVVQRHIEAAKAKREADDSEWDLSDVVVREMVKSATGETRIDVQFVPLLRTSLFTELEDYGGRINVMRWQDIRDYIRRLHAAGEEPLRYIYASHVRIAYPWNCLAMALAGVVIAIRRRGTHVVVEVAIAMAVAVAFHSLNSFCESVGESGRLPAWLCAWFPPALLTAVGLRLLGRAGLQ